MPYIEKGDLYFKMRKDEPWDSPHNTQFIDEVIKAYEVPGGKNEPGKTRLLALAVPEESHPGRANADAKRGDASKSILLVEVDPDRQVVTWTKPDDFEFDPENPFAGLGMERDGKFNVVLGDCSMQGTSPMAIRECSCGC